MVQCLQNPQTYTVKEGRFISCPYHRCSLMSPVIIHVGLGELQTPRCIQCRFCFQYSWNSKPSLSVEFSCHSVVVSPPLILQKIGTFIIYMKQTAVVSLSFRGEKLELHYTTRLFLFILRFHINKTEINRLQKYLRIEFN